MRKSFFYFSYVFLFIYQTASAQSQPELLNSGDLIEQGVKFNDDGKYKEAIEVYSKVSRSDTNGAGSGKYRCQEPKRYANTPGRCPR